MNALEKNALNSIRSEVKQSPSSFNLEEFSFLEINVNKVFDALIELLSFSGENNKIIKNEKTDDPLKCSTSSSSSREINVEKPTTDSLIIPAAFFSRKKEANFLNTSTDDLVKNSIDSFVVSLKKENYILRNAFKEKLESFIIKYFKKDFSLDSKGFFKLDSLAIPVEDEDKLLEMNEEEERSSRNCFSEVFEEEGAEKSVDSLDDFDVTLSDYINEEEIEPAFKLNYHFSLFKYRIKEIEKIEMVKIRHVMSCFFAEISSSFSTRVVEALRVNKLLKNISYGDSSAFNLFATILNRCETSFHLSINQFKIQPFNYHFDFLRSNNLLFKSLPRFFQEKRYDEIFCLYEIIVRLDLKKIQEINKIFICCISELIEKENDIEVIKEIISKLFIPIFKMQPSLSMLQNFYEECDELPSDLKRGQMIDNHLQSYFSEIYEATEFRESLENADLIKASDLDPTSFLFNFFILAKDKTMKLTMGEVLNHFSYNKEICYVFLKINKNNVKKYFITLFLREKSVEEFLLFFFNKEILIDFLSGIEVEKEKIGSRSEIVKFRCLLMREFLVKGIDKYNLDCLLKSLNSLIESKCDSISLSFIKYFFELLFDINLNLNCFDFITEVICDLKVEFSYQELIQLIDIMIQKNKREIGSKIFQKKFLDCIDSNPDILILFQKFKILRHMVYYDYLVMKDAPKTFAICAKIFKRVVPKEEILPISVPIVSEEESHDSLNHSDGTSIEIPVDEQLFGNLALTMNEKEDFRYAIAFASVISKDTVIKDFRNAKKIYKKENLMKLIQEKCEKPRQFFSFEDYAAMS